MNTIKNSMDGAISRIDTMNNFPKVMSNLGISAKDSTQAINRLSEGLQGIPTTLDAGALAVQRFTSKNGDVEKSVDIFLAVNDAILAGGASTEIQASALEQLSQSYAKGKMDMMEWRSIQTAMPAQLKQVASAMGVTTDELGEMLRTGDNTEKVFDEFINTIIKMDKTGVKGFKSLKEQARNATGGINTSITNMKTAITRGVANMIQEFDKVLKKKGLGGISEIISQIGKQAENLAKYCTKGSLVGVTGRIQTRNYDGQDGKKVYVTEVAANNVTFLTPKNSNVNEQSIGIEITQNIENENLNKTENNI